jgi:hypothetical protein
MNIIPLSPSFLHPPSVPPVPICRAYFGSVLEEVVPCLAHPTTFPGYKHPRACYVCMYVCVCVCVRAWEKERTGKWIDKPSSISFPTPICSCILVYLCGSLSRFLISWCLEYDSRIAGKPKKKNATKDIVSLCLLLLAPPHLLSSPCTWICVRLRKEEQGGAEATNVWGWHNPEGNTQHEQKKKKTRATIIIPCLSRFGGNEMSRNVR